ncbi:MAG: hypothetical protein ACJAT2_002702 [Bacteriovoracaceae bacterium]|jgi:hypothetical protein
MKCGEYQVFAKIFCHKGDSCKLLVGESKQSKLEVKLATNGYNLSYFSGQHITIKMQLTKLKGSFEGKALETPVRQFGAIKKAGLELIKAESCK